ncbi:MAG: alternative ribosome rescue aminoacyl-tRNA hydrolase ArfB [Pseudohongiellaceae bacterium]
MTASEIINSSEIQFSAVRSSGPGGQHVNKVATAVQLRFDIRASSLSSYAKQRLLDYPDRRISSDGIVVIKAQSFRSQDKNRADAERRLTELVAEALAEDKPRVATKPGPAARERRLRDKREQGEKKLRRVSIRHVDDE